MIKKILSNVSNKAKAIYLLWILFNFCLLIINTSEISFDDQVVREKKLFREGKIYTHNKLEKDFPYIPHSTVFFPL